MTKSVASLKPAYLQAEERGAEIEVTFAFLEEFWKGKTITSRAFVLRNQLVTRIESVEPWV